MLVVDQIIGWIRSGGMLNIKRWSIKGGVVIFDQGLFSAGNFLLNLLLARWLTPTLFGAFSISFALFLFLTGLYNALILEPMSVFATSKYHDRLKPYISTQFILHIFLSMVIGGMAVFIDQALYYYQVISAVVADAILGMSVFLPLILSIWVVRRACYILEKPRWALISSHAYFTTLLIGIWIVFTRFSMLNGFIWFAVIGGASLIGSIIGVIFIYSGFPSLPELKLQWRNILSEQWRFGRWIVVATMFYFIGSQIQVFFVASMLSLASAGAYRALQILILPFLQALTAISTLIFPSIAFGYGRGDYFLVRRKSIQFTAAVFSASVLYELILVAGSGLIDRFLFGGKYAAYIWLLPLIGLIPILDSLVNGISLVLRSLQKPHFYLIDKGLVAIVGSLTAYLFIGQWGLVGSVLSLIAVEMMGLITHIWLYRSWFIPLLKPVQALT